MKGINFKESNKVWAENQPEYLPIHTFTNDKHVIECFHLTLLERIKLLIKGKVWLSLLMFGNPLTPVFMSVDKKDIFVKEQSDGK